jgi:tetratricopeptide (TPR) repeat protein
LILCLHSLYASVPDAFLEEVLIMNISAKQLTFPRVAALMLAIWFVCPGVFAAPVNTNGASAIVVSVEGTVEILRLGAREWTVASVGSSMGVGDQLRTGQRSRATLRLSNLSVLRVGELMSYEIEPSPTAAGKPTLNLKSGSAYFFSRDRPQEVQIRTPTVTGAIRGTEFNVLVGPDGRTTVTMIDGEVELTNSFGSLALSGGEQGVAEEGRAPVKTAVLNAVNVIQWNLYYPGALDLAELDLNAGERGKLAESLAAYQRGELLEALKKYPADHQPESAADHLYLGALLLSVGLVDQTMSHLEAAASGGGNNPALANALRELVAAVKFETWKSPGTPTLATEFLAESYYQQSRANLAAALTAARQAVEKSPSFGFAWERVAELEFSFGHTAAALDALNKSLALAPRNPQAFALKGFLLSAQGRISEAIQSFDEAIAIDGGLGNAWLGRGLCRIRRGQAEAGREDLEVAAALEPNRAVLRSYLGKAFNETRDYVRAGHELELARKFDPNDPTSWLYSALLLQQENRINEAIRDLEKSQELNDNRSVYRSRMLLDQDAAVRGANLADIYRDAGMDDVSVREATRAVNYDYANYSAHLFLADSYNQLRDPNQINLRYETPWLSEYLVANLLAPVGAGTLSQTVSQQEYSKLFEQDKFGLVSSTEYLSDGSWVQSGSQYGTVGNFGWAVDTLYRSDNGQRANNDQEQLTTSLQLKWDVTPRDSVFVQGIYYDATAGDLTQYYNQSSANTDLHTTETQEPLALIGYRHEWSPGVETLALAGRFYDKSSVNDTNNPVLLLAVDGAGQVIAVPTPALPTASLNYHSQLEIYSGELQQIWEQEKHTFVLGARYQYGTFDTQTALGATTPTYLANTNQVTPFPYSATPTNQSVSPNFERVTGYGYYYWQIFEPLLLNAGLSYDYLQFPQNYRSAPISAGERSEDQVSPKAGFTWTPLRDTVVRFAYTRSLGGVSFDQSVRLEPSQVAGFNQAFRSLIPEAIAGSTAGAKFETYELALEQKFKTGTYLAIEGQILNSDVSQTIGAMDLIPPYLPPFPLGYISGVSSNTLQDLDYTEENLIVTANQLLGDCWSLGARYQLSRVDLTTRYPEIPASVTSANYTKNTATLNQLNLFALFNHPSGLFARVEGNWYSQSNDGYTPAEAGDDFWQVNLFGGYRFWHRHAQIQVGVLNLNDQDYHLNPLNLYTELPRQRTFAVNFQFNF